MWDGGKIPFNPLLKNELYCQDMCDKSNKNSLMCTLFRILFQLKFSWIILLLESFSFSKFLICHIHRNFQCYGKQEFLYQACIWIILSKRNFFNFNFTDDTANLSDNHCLSQLLEGRNQNIKDFFTFRIIWFYLWWNYLIA